MGWRYRKRIRVGPLNINVSRRGVGTSWGVPGIRVTRSSTGRRYMTFSLPRTGLSWQKGLTQRRHLIPWARRRSHAPQGPTGAPVLPNVTTGSASGAGATTYPRQDSRVPTLRNRSSLTGDHGGSRAVSTTSRSETTRGHPSGTAGVL